MSEVWASFARTLVLPCVDGSVWGPAVRAFLKTLLQLSLLMNLGVQPLSQELLFTRAVSSWILEIAVLFFFLSLFLKQICDLLTPEAF
jgi:hypothetical protein